MHPDVMRELANQRGREMGARAREARLARRIRKEARRPGHRRAADRRAA
jgi:hypothetical protein